MSFCIQSNFWEPTKLVTESSFYGVIRDKGHAVVISEVRLGKELARVAAETGNHSLATSFTNEANEQKKKLPGFVFQSTFMPTESKQKRILGNWRKQSASILNGLCMIDVDHLGDSVSESQGMSVGAAAKSGPSVGATGKNVGSTALPESPKKSVASAGGLGARETFEAFRQKVDFDKEGIMLVYITPSGHGLKIVFKARLEWGNLIDNQHQMAALLGVEVDEACKDSARLSFICTEEDLLFINKEIFTYENKEYGERWNETYRRGNSQATLHDNGARHTGGCVDRGDADGHGAVGNGKDVDGGGAGADGEDEMKEKEEGRTKEDEEAEGAKAAEARAEGAEGAGAAGAKTAEAKTAEAGAAEAEAALATQQTKTHALKTYHGVPYHEIIDKWLEGRVPQEGDRHTTLLKLATQLRYICDRSTAMVTEVLKQEQWVADYIKEDSSALTAIRDACEYKYSLNIPKQLQAVLAKVLPNEHQAEEKEYDGLPFDFWGDKIEAMMAYYPCLREVCAELKKDQYPAALFASAAFFGTLMTRTWYHFYHHPEQERRLNYSVFIIGDPGSGKSFVGRLYNLIAIPIIMKDQVGNNAINRYKKEMKERGTSSKEQKKAPLKQPTPIIRIHGTRTANGVFIEDMCNAVEVVGNKSVHLHMLTFDAELDASTAASKGGQWIDKSTMELKAFHNEEDNQQYKNVDSVTGPFNVYWNFVYTGTPLSLDRKVTERNFGSGLSTRLACIPFPGDNLEMMKWREKSKDTQKSDRLLNEWAFRLDKVSGELPIRDLVKTTWQWTDDRMTIAKINENKADGLLIKRIAYYGIAISMPYILMRHWEEWEQTKTLTMDEKDQELARLVMNIQYECQRYFFGGYAERYFDNLNSDRNLKAVKHRDKTISIFSGLNNEFMMEDLYNTVDISDIGIRKMVSTWMSLGYVERIGLRRPATYRKLKTAI